MSSIRLDKIAVSSFHDSFGNYSTQTGTLTISGTIPPGGKDFSIDFTIPRDGTVVEVWATKNSRKRSLDNVQRNSEYSGTTFATNFVRYSGATLTVGMNVSNPGSSFTATTQSFDISVVAFDAPIVY